MIYVAQTINGDYINLGQPVEVQIDRSIEAPADCISAIFPVNGKFGEFKNISVYEDEKRVFYGPIDRQKATLNGYGSFLNISARSMAALLLDNEACPQIYYVPSLWVIFSRHVKPYGFSEIYGNRKTFPEEFVVPKGMSEWEVLESFCADYLRVYPRVNYDGTVDATEKSPSGSSVLFANTGDAIKYSSICENIQRCKLYSEVYVRATKEDTYSLRVYDKNAIDTGIAAKRYLNAVGDVKTPVICGELMLNSARKGAYEINLTLPGSSSVKVGDRASIEDRVFGRMENLIISKTKYVLDEKVEKTEIVMQRGDV